MELLAKFADLYKLPPRYIALVAAVTGALLFSPKWFLDRMHLSDIPAPYGAIVGIVFLVSLGLVLINATVALNSATKRRQWSKKRRQLVKDVLAQLDPLEQAILREFVLCGVSTLNIPLEYPPAAGLESKGILRRVGNYGRYSSHGMMFPYQMSELARELITVDNLGMSEYSFQNDKGETDFTPEGIEWFEMNRPAFVFRRHSSF